jgi:hypothetical protein
MGPLDDRGLSPPRTTAPARKLAGRGGLRSPDQFGPSCVRETIRVFQHSPPGASLLPARIPRYYDLG